MQFIFDFLKHKLFKVKSWPLEGSKRGNERNQLYWEIIQDLLMNMIEKCLTR